MSIFSDVDVRVFADFGSGLTRIDNDNGKRSIDWKRGRRRKVGRVETGEINIDLDNQNGWLFPDNPASPYHPGVALDAPIVVDCVIDTVTYPLFSGYLSDVDPDWKLQYAWVTLTAVGEFSALARTELPDSLFAYEISRSTTAVGWWTLADTIPGYVAARLGDDGATTGDPTTGVDSLLDLEPQTAGMAFDERPGSRVVLPASAAVQGVRGSIEVWFRAAARTDPGSQQHQYLAFQLGPTVETIYLRINSTDHFTAPGQLQAFVSDGNNLGDTLTTTSGPTFRVDDNAVHHALLRFGPEGGSTALRLVLDGVQRGFTTRPGTLDPGPGTMYVGNTGGGNFNLNGTIQHFVTHNDIVLLADAARHALAGSMRPAPLHSAATVTAANGNNELTGARLNRILDITGNVAPRFIANGTQTCSPAILEREPALTYIDRVISTEGPDAWFFADSSGRLVFYESGATPQSNGHPASPGVFPTIDDSESDGNVPYISAKPRYSGTRAVDRVEVRRRGGIFQAAGATEENSRASKPIDTLHTTPAAASASAQAYLEAFAGLTIELERAELLLNRDDVPTTEAIGIEPGATVRVIGRPPNAPILDQESIITSVSHNLQFAGSPTWRTVIDTIADYREASA